MTEKSSCKVFARFFLIGTEATWQQVHFFDFMGTAPASLTSSRSVVANSSILKGTETMRCRPAILVAWWSVLAATQGCNQGEMFFGSKNKSKQAEQPPDPRNQLLVRLAGQEQQERLQTLLRIIQSEPEKVLRRDALNYLSGLGTDSRPISESLGKQLLIETDADVVRDLKHVLIDSEANVEAILLSAVPNADADLLLRIVQTLGDTRACSAETITFLQQQCHSTRIELVIAACQSIEKIGPAAKALLPVLINIAERPRVSLETSGDEGRAFRFSRELTRAAVRAISAVGAEESTISVLTSCLAMEPDIAAIAADSLARIGFKAAAALPALEQLKSRDDHGGKDIKTSMARASAMKAIAALNDGVSQ